MCLEVEAAYVSQVNTVQSLSTEQNQKKPGQKKLKSTTISFVHSV